MEGDAVDGPVHRVCREQVVQTSNETKTGLTPGPSHVSLE